ncbi:MAG: hypothetical protein COW88_00535 [Candidatus Lloydbacteria bacterium CG22_combo_CG10-13_8_21_14_all_47_15]|uniref:Aspartate--tRNA(Asp/Asn) ligase n=1 Tax=Candidatus Lloydbacteria bacterium CG22_combo_CG10-13_8_21_14_all_47_15 TaxID=1974635 RepID=A0A2H0CVH5_9BACT|nr:MAG: hypothetical protein COW88_00535 [Candidatus Lloydbacteria bacterium CG22_combo_CG10-13_8_21_14_all_47_15]
MERIYIKNLHGAVDTEVSVSGFVSVRRDHGKLIFLDIRDETGFVQAVALPKEVGAHEMADKLRPEWSIRVSGTVKKRPEKMVNSEQENGDIELVLSSIEILNEATTPPFDISTDGYDVGEEHRLRYRYIDLRRARLQKNIRMRHKILKKARDFFDARGFVEIETPILTKSTPEGARDYLVPSRLYPGQFYALPQAPQQYKQILMASGFEKYFQIARVFRDEDTRGDRQPEFTQLDIEEAFIERDAMLALNEAFAIAVIEECFPDKIIQEKPFPRISYKNAMEQYGTDRPDLRKDKNNPNLLAFAWIVDFPFFEKDERGGWTFTHNPFSAPKTEHRDELLKKENIGNILAEQYDLALNGFEIAGGSLRNHQPKALEAVLEIIGFSPERIKSDFGHMLSALGSGAPPHGGIAWGVDRLIAALMNEPNIREVIAFPKTGEGRDLMMDTPSSVEAKQLDELGLSIKKEKH